MKSHSVLHSTWPRSWLRLPRVQQCRAPARMRRIKAEGVDEEGAEDGIVPCAEMGEPAKGRLADGHEARDTLLVVPTDEIAGVIGLGAGIGGFAFRQENLEKRELKARIWL